MKYICYDYFSVRTPVLPTKYAQELIEMEDVCSILEYIKNNKLDKYLTEALQISSQSLYEAVLRIEADEKLDRATCISLYKYLLRASSKTTPYGILAAVALSTFDRKGEPYVRNINMSKEVKIDNLWIFKLIKQLEDNLRVRKGLKLIWNTSTYISQNRVVNPHFSNHGIAEKNISKKMTSIKFNNLILLIMKQTQNYIKYENLFEIVKNNYNEVDDDKIFETLNFLIDQEYIFTDLRLPAYAFEPLIKIVEELGNCTISQNMEEKLKEIHTCIEKYKLCSVSKSEYKFNALTEKMEKICKADNYIEVNAGIQITRGKLDVEVKKRVESFVETISCIGMDSEVFSGIYEFKKHFTEEYGSNIEVPLIEIIDPCGFDGLQYVKENKYNPNERELKIQNFFDVKIQDTLINKRNSVNITKEEILNLADDRDIKKNFPISIDLNVFISEEQDGKHLAIGPNYGADTAGKMIQRFAGVLDSKQLNKYNHIYNIANRNKKYISVELREMPIAGRLSNVVNATKNYKYYVAIGTPQNEDASGAILLQDLLIGSSANGSFYIKSESKNKICKMVTNNMLNSNYNSRLYNLLKEISSEYEDVKLIERLSNLCERNYFYTPEIIIDGIVVSHAKWRFTNQHIKGNSLEEFKINFKIVYSRYELDEYVYICKSDQRLPIKITNDIAIEILYQEFKKNNIIELQKLETSVEEKGFIKNDKGEVYTSEFIFSFYSEEQNTVCNVDENIKIQNQNRVVPPFNDGWVFLKLYIPEEMENEVLVRFLSNKEHLKFENFFFVRYSDETGRHIRLRIKYVSEEVSIKYFKYVSLWLQNIRREGLLRFWSINEYRRENNRYGGAEVMSVVEKLFFVDSEYVINILSKNDMSINNVKTNIYIEAMSKLLYELTGSKKRMLEILDKVVDKGQYRKEYVKSRSEHIRNLEKYLHEEDCRKKEAIAIRNNISMNKQYLANKVDDILLSILHMCCNRLTGNREIEEKTLCFFRHALYDVIKREKYLS